MNLTVFLWSVSNQRVFFSKLWFRKSEGRNFIESLILIIRHTTIHWSGFIISWLPTAPVNLKINLLHTFCMDIGHFMRFTRRFTSQPISPELYVGLKWADWFLSELKKRIFIEKKKILGFGFSKDSWKLFIQYHKQQKLCEKDVIIMMRSNAQTLLQLTEWDKV